MANSGRSRVREDRFYSPPAMRRYNQQQQQKVQQEEQKEQPQKQEQLMSVSSNLDRFMKHTTPVVTAQHFPKTSIKGWRNHDGDYHPYFVLGDLWESLKEWSAYGAGVPLVLNDSDSVVQYYVPYLSAIQLYVDPSAPLTPLTTTRRPGEESDSDSSRATSSDGSYEADAIRQKNSLNSVNQRFNKLIIGDDSFSEIRNPPGLLIFEYFERASPFHRAPLADKIADLASKFPELKSYRSCDLTQSSWVSVAWYPIYRIPVGPSLQNVDASFLTYHSLSTPITSTDRSTVREVHETGMPCRLSLPIFGLAVYKFKTSEWTQSGVHGTEKVNSLMHSTENWLRSLDVDHPDFVFFKTHNFWR